MKIWDSAKAFRTNHLFVRGGSMIYQVASTYNLVTFRQNCMEMKKIGPKGTAFEFFLCRSATSSLKCIFNANKMKFYTVQRSSIPILLHFKVCFVDVSTRIIVLLEYGFVLFFCSMNLYQSALADLGSVTDARPRLSPFFSFPCTFWQKLWQIIG